MLECGCQTNKSERRTMVLDVDMGVDISVDLIGCFSR
jgi:hypothetical protein